VAVADPRVGLAWSSKSSRAVGDIYFANARDGYLFGPGLESTDDGGRTWRVDRLSAVRGVAGGSGRVYALARSPSHRSTLQIWGSAAGSRRWTRLPAPSLTGHPELAVQGRTMALLEPGSDLAQPRGRRGRLWTSSDGGRSWQRRVVPCRPVTDGGASILSIALDNPDAFLLDCFSNQQSSQEQNTQHHLFGSSDAGRSWTRLADPTRHGRPVSLADNGDGHAFLTTESGGADSLVGTLDGAVHWHHVLDSGGSFYGWNDLGFVTTNVGYVVGPTHYAPEHLYRTIDAGRTWHRLAIETGRPAGARASHHRAACTGRDLAASWFETSDHAGDTNTGWIALRDRAANSCDLHGPVRLEAIGRPGDWYGPPVSERLRSRLTLTSGARSLMRGHLAPATERVAYVLVATLDSRPDGTACQKPTVPAIYQIDLPDHDGAIDLNAPSRDVTEAISICQSNRLETGRISTEP
jgi:hypothetical protein